MSQLSEAAADRLAPSSPGMMYRDRISNAQELRDWCRSTWSSLDQKLERFIDAALDGPQEEERLIRFLVALEMMRDQLAEFEKLVEVKP